ncbi:MAG TPA: RNA 2',3'-cyclic phosphodiesterase, partial [Stellaceae bacterium]|nr:RNA 2',3'-cyclic phosphodiesterase [Stellaceae bacterium]
MLRLFVGIALPPEQKLGLSLIASGLPGSKWVDPGNYHLTLRFIVETSESDAADVDAALAGIRARRFSLTLAGVGHFGTHALWAGIEKNPDLMQLHA